MAAPIIVGITPFNPSRMKIKRYVPKTGTISFSCHFVFLAQPFKRFSSTYAAPVEESVVVSVSLSNSNKRPLWIGSMTHRLKSQRLEYSTHSQRSSIATEESGQEYSRSND